MTVPVPTAGPSTPRPRLPGPPRPGSPWPGSRHEVRHRWQLDRATTLVQACALLGDLAAELVTADRAGWRLQEPLAAGHLLAARPSRRERGRGLAPPPIDPTPNPAPGAWRLRVVDEPPTTGSVAFTPDSAPHSPVLAWTGRRLDQTGGPQLPAEDLLAVTRQATLAGSPPRSFGIARARGGPNLDLVADGSALRLHAVRDGVLLRTGEALVFHHAADGARTLLTVAAAYHRLAREIGDLAAAGAELVGTDDGFLEIAYDPTGRS